MKHVAAKGSGTIVTNVDEKSIQPNAVDLRVDKVFKLLRSDEFKLSDEDKRPVGRELMPLDLEGFYFLDAGAYEVTMLNNIKVGDYEAGWVVARSTLIRNGIYLMSGLYDSGYEGTMNVGMFVSQGIFRLKKGTRIGQYLSFSAEALHKYNGSYQQTGFLESSEK